MISFEEARRRYSQSTVENKQSILNINAAQPITGPFDYETAKQEALKGKDWYINMVRATASLVSTGATDKEIETEMVSWTIPPYSKNETLDDVRKAVFGARNKNFDKKANSKDSPPKTEPFFQKLSTIELKPIEYLIEGFIPKQSMAMMFGDPGSAKSFLAIDAGCCVSIEKDYHGYKTSLGTVLYLAGEGIRGVTQRCRGWYTYHGAEVEDASIYISRHGLGLRDQNQLEFIKEEIDALVTAGKKPELIIIDTLARNFGGGDENATKDMSEFIDAVDALINRYEAAALIVHHSGHSDKQRARGNSTLNGALDAEYKISKNARFVYLNCTKMKDAPEPDGLNFILEDITISDTSGKLIQTVVPIKRTDEVERFRLTPNDAKNLEQFRKPYIELYGEYNSDNSISLTLDEWRPIFYKKHHGDSQDTKRKAFERARKGLVGKGILDVSDDIYTFTPRPTGRVRDIIKTANDDYASEDRTDTDTPL